MTMSCRLRGLAAVLLVAGGLASATTAQAEDLVDFLWGGSEEYGGGRSTVSFDPKYKPGQIIVSFSDRRLYFIDKPGHAITYPVAVPMGEARWQGVTFVSEKKVNPAWTPTPDMVRQNPRLPRWVPGGHPMNPLGIRAMYLGSSAYRIHGTDAPWTIGQAVSHGCIRMTNQDVLDLYPRVPVGMRVTVTWEHFSSKVLSSSDDDDAKGYAANASANYNNGAGKSYGSSASSSSNSSSRTSASNDTSSSNGSYSYGAYGSSNSASASAAPKRKSGGFFWEQQDDDDRSASASAASDAEKPAPVTTSKKKTEKVEKSDELAKADDGDKTEKAEKSEKSEKSEKLEKAEKSEKSDRSEKVAKGEEADKSAKIEKSEKAERAERSEKSEKAIAVTKKSGAEAAPAAFAKPSSVVPDPVKPAIEKAKLEKPATPVTKASAEDSLPVQKASAEIQ